MAEEQQFGPWTWLSPEEIRDRRVTNLIHCFRDAMSRADHAGAMLALGQLRDLTVAEMREAVERQAEELAAQQLAELMDDLDDL